MSVYFMLMGAWLFGADATALAFSQAEVSILFSAPLSRRQLINYQPFPAQIALLHHPPHRVLVSPPRRPSLPAPLPEC
mgnify:CR=1 FL=1